jgi:uncharacterized protein (TIGR03067 family)
MKPKIFVCGLTLLFALAACKTGTFQMNDAQALQGAWICKSAVVNGKSLPLETVKLLRLTIIGNRYKTEKGSEVLFDSTYRINTSNTPKQISMVGTEGEMIGKEAHGIYSLQMDTLQICYTLPGEPSPTSFESPAGSKAYLIIWRRL